MSSKKYSRVYVEITNICNLNCSFCHNNKRDKKFMSISDFSHIIDEVKGYIESKLPFFGGWCLSLHFATCCQSAR